MSRASRCLALMLSVAVAAVAPTSAWATAADAADAPVVQGDATGDGGSAPQADPPRAGDDAGEPAEAAGSLESGAEPEAPAAPDEGAPDEGGAGEEGEIRRQEADQSARSRLVCQAHVQNGGWTGEVGEGAVIGSAGRGLRLEALRISLAKDAGLPSGSLRYGVHVQNLGWQGWRQEGKVAGTTGRGLRIEAFQLRLYGDLAQEYDVYYRAHVQNVGWMAWARNGAVVGSIGRSLRLEALQVVLVSKEGGAVPSSSGQATGRALLGATGISGRAHVQNLGWRSAGTGSTLTLGTTGRSLRLEALTLSLAGAAAPGGISYRAHVQNVGWQGRVSDGRVAGTVGRGLRVEAVEASLSGEAAGLYDLYYRAHVSNIGWLAWAREGAVAGSQGLALPIEALQVALVAEGAAAPANTGAALSVASVPAARLSVRGLIQGESDWRSPVGSGGTVGTTGKSRRLEGLAASVASELGGQLEYRASVQGSGWGGWVSGGERVGSSGRRIEAIGVRLSGELSRAYDVWYRAHVSDFGWLGWARNGASAGTKDLGKSIEAVQVKLSPKGASAPGTTSLSFIDSGHLRDRVVAAAYSQIGSAYSGINDYYRANVAFNCSGFTYYCYLRAGYTIPRKQGYYSYYWNERNMTNSQMWWVESRGNWTTNVATLKPGDLVFFSPVRDKWRTGHVGIYVGGGMMIDSYPGLGVSRRSVYQSGFVGGGNPIL